MIKVYIQVYHDGQCWSPRCRVYACARIIVEHIIGQPNVTASILAGERNRTSYPDYTQLLTNLVRSATYLS